MYITAQSMEELDIATELNCMFGVSYAAEHHQIYDPDHKDADFEISVLDEYDLDGIKQLLSEFGMSAWIVEPEKEFKI